LVGSKDFSKFSTKMFNSLSKLARKFKLPTTKLQGLLPWYEVDTAYVAKSDTFYLCIRNTFFPKFYAKKMEDLERIFDKIEISPTDKIKF